LLVTYKGVLPLVLPAVLSSLSAECSIVVLGGFAGPFVTVSELAAAVVC
jgi:hypothetical protein